MEHQPPPGVVVSMDSCSDRNPTPRDSNPRTVSIRCGSERPSLSKRHTAKASPARSAAITSASCGRSVLDPDAVSVHVRQHPTALSASCCNAGSCTVVDTLAYPSSSPTSTHCAVTRRRGRARHADSGAEFRNTSLSGDQHSDQHFPVGSRTGAEVSRKRS